MRTETLDITDGLDRLLAAVDVDLRHLEDSLAALDRLRRLVVQQDTDGLQQLLTALQADAQQYRRHELMRQQLRQDLARAAGCGVAEITLTRFETALHGERKAAVSLRKERLGTLTARLKKETAATGQLLADCGRFNRQLLNSIFAGGRTEAPTYTAAGAARRPTETVFMDVQF